MTFVVDDRGRKLLPAAEIARGGEGVIHAVADDPRSVVKLWHPDIDRDVRAVREIAHRTADALASRSRRPAVVPPAVVSDAAGVPVGVVLPTLPDCAVVLADHLLPEERLRLGIATTGLWSIRVAARIASAVARAHRRDIVLADISPRNVAIDLRRGRVILFDADAWQPGDGPVTPRRVIEDVRPPEQLVGPDARPSQHGDCWSLAMTVVLVLLDGRHPFDGARDDGSPPLPYVEANVRAGHSHLTTPRLRPYAGCPDPSVLPPKTRALARTALGPGHRHPERRPDAETWARALAADAAAYVPCPGDPTSHRAHPDARCAVCALTTELTA